MQVKSTHRILRVFGFNKKAVLQRSLFSAITELAFSWISQKYLRKDRST